MWYNRKRQFYFYGITVHGFVYTSFNCRVIGRTLNKLDKSYAFTLLVSLVISHPRSQILSLLSLSWFSCSALSWLCLHVALPLTILISGRNCVRLHYKITICNDKAKYSKRQKGEKYQASYRLLHPSVFISAIEMQWNYTLSIIPFFEFF